MNRLEVTLPGVASSVPPARHFVERTLEAWGLEGLGWTAALVVTELSANAALHTGGAFTVAVSQEGDAVRIEVSDGSPAAPRLRHHSQESTTGRGLRLVRDLARAWGCTPTATGKVVWAELAASLAPGDDAADDTDDADSLATLLASFPDTLDEPGTTGTLSALLRPAA